MQKTKDVFRLSIAVFFFWLILIMLGKEKAPFQELALASAIYFICCLPFLIYLGRQERNIPYLPVFGACYFVYFSLSIFVNRNLYSSNSVTSQTIIECLKLVLWGFVSLMVAFYTPISQVVDFMTIPLKISWDYRKAFRIGSFVGFLGLMVYYSTFTGGLSFGSGYSAPMSFLISLSRLGIAILFLLQLQNRLKPSGKILLWCGLFIPRTVLDLITGTTFPLILDFMLLFFLYFYYYRKFPWSRIVMVGAFFFILFSVRDEFRKLTWVEGEYENASPREKVGLYIKLAYQKLTAGKEKYSAAYQKLSGRMDNLVTFSRVVEMTPRYVPYWEGYSYSTLLSSFIPRLFMPKKPEKRLGQEFGHRYMFLNPRDVTTSYNLPMVIEMYINFGPIAIIVGMFILGLIYRALYALFNHPASGDGGLLLSTMIFINLLNIDSDFSLVFGNIIQYMILFYIILKVMRTPVEKIR